MQEKMLNTLEFNKIITKLEILCTSILGKELCGKLNPSNNVQEVQISQHETSQAVSMIISKGKPPFGGIKDIRYSLLKAEKEAILSPKELIDIADTLRASKNLIAYFGESISLIPSERHTDTSGRYTLLQPLFDGLYSNRNLEERIFSCIISDEEIADTASPTLHSIRRQIQDAEQGIKDRLNSMIRSSAYQKYLQESIVTIRAGRYVLPVKQEYKNEINGLVHDSSASGATLFIEPMAVVEANNLIKQLRIKESAEIERILSELTAMVANIKVELDNTIILLAKLDFIFAKAELSFDMKAIEPIITQSGSINLRKARHPLLNPENVVPIDIWCGEEFNTLVITGPNTGGKTVTLKTVGLMTLMAQAGLHIPCAENSVVNVFENIFADIGDEQSIEQSLSTFSSHMVNIVQILEQAGSNSLILLDELGAGTDPVEGAAIAMSILEYLHNNNAMTFATTHYSELKTFAISTPGIENASCEFDVETLKPTYRLLIGVPGKSNAFAISGKLGLSDSIIQRAKDFVSSEDTKFEDIISEVEKNRANSQRHLEEIEILKADIEKYKNEIEKQRDEMSRQKQKLIQEAREEAYHILEEAKEEADKAIKEIQLLAQAEESERNKKSEHIRNKLRNKLGETEKALVQPLFNANTNKKPYKFNIGDTVHIASLDQEGTVLSLPDESSNILVQAGIMKVKINASQLKPLKHDKVSIGNLGISKALTSKKTMNVSTELDLRGQALDEALDNTDKYLDDVSIAGLKLVTIIHGKGTGILKNGIHQFLKHHPHVKSFRLGKYGEGEQGVTIVELN